MSNVNLFYSVLPADRLWLPHEIPPKLLIPSKSFVFNFLQRLWGNFSTLGLEMVQTNGTPFLVAEVIRDLRCHAGAGLATWGLQLGTNGAATGITDFCLGALIPHGTAAGQLYYYAMSFVNPYIVGSTAYAAVRRNARNATANTISVAELGWTGAVTDGNFLCMFARDIFAPAVTIGADVTVQFVYTLQITA